MGLNKVTVDDVNYAGKKVLCRCDFNVPLKDGKITDENRLVAALPTIKKLIADGGKVILCSHLGKPKGEPKPELSLAPVAKRLSELLSIHKTVISYLSLSVLFKLILLYHTFFILFSQAQNLKSKSPRLLHLRLSDFLMRGGDSEFINYLKYILQRKCVYFVFKK